MIEESVKVIAIEENILILQAQRESTCQSCSVQKGCGTSVLSQWLGKKLSIFHVENTINAHVGDVLIVGIPENSLLSGSLMVYFMPLVSLIMCAMLADWLMSESAYRDIWAIVSGILGLYVGVRLSKVLLSRLPSKNLSPVILRKNIEHVKLAR